MHEKTKNNIEFNLRRSKRQSELFKKLHKEGKINYNTFIGKHHSEETKRKIGEKNSIHQKGEGNSQFGKCWIYNSELKESKSIKKEDLNIWLDFGWIKGRKINF